MASKAEVFNINDAEAGIFRKLAEGITTRVFPGDKAMLSIVTLEPNAIGKMHQHPEEQWGVLLEGSLTRFQGDEQFEVSVGDFWRTPPDIPHTVKAGANGAKVLDIFAPAREDYLKPGEGFGGA